ncbi:DotH/IcmK family type IV secretion protein [Alphaproteobacteria bacterium]|nr:DotH/IcmK family type IV secretion protein [Alphaproteobacteria bacterium]
MIALASIVPVSQSYAQNSDTSEFELSDPREPILNPLASDPDPEFEPEPPSEDERFDDPMEELTLDDLTTPEFLLGDDDDPLGLNEEESFDLEKSKTELLEDARRHAFEAALQSILPLRPNEIREMLEQYDRTQESVEVPVYPPPKPKTVVQNISLDPGAPPEVIKLAYGHVTTLSILDITGAPWPIEDISWAGDFEITETEEGEGSHIIRIAPRAEYVNGNMSMRLLTLKTPVILSLETNRDLVHYRFDAIIPEYGPLAEAPLINSGLNIKAGNNTLSAILEGVVPANAKRLSVSGVDGRTSAYKLGNTTFVRTPLTLLSPSWSNSVRSADGMQVFVIKESPVLLLSDNGKMVRARLSTREDIFDDR